MNSPVVAGSSHYTPTQTQWRCRGRGNNSLAVTVVKEKVSELEYKVRRVFSRQLRKDLTGVVEAVSGMRRLLLGF